MAQFWMKLVSIGESRPRFIRAGLDYGAHGSRASRHPANRLPGCRRSPRMGSLKVAERIFTLYCNARPARRFARSRACARLARIALGKPPVREVTLDDPTCFRCDRENASLRSALEAA